MRLTSVKLHWNRPRSILNRERPDADIAEPLFPDGVGGFGSISRTVIALEFSFARSVVPSYSCASK